jgi:hypothetical protein
LAKRFLFIGYSLSDSDVDIVKILEELNAAFSGHLPPSWLLAYRFSPELQERVSRYGVTVIDPQHEIPEAVTAEEAFTTFLCRLGSETLKFKVEQEVDNIFRPRVPTAARVVSPFELEAMNEQILTLDLPKAFNLFRGLMDRSVIPEHLQNQAIKIFESLAARCQTTQDLVSLDAAAANLRFRSVANTVEMLAILFAATIHDTRGHMESFLFAASKHSGKPYLQLSIARAIDRLQSANLNVTDGFRYHASAWLRDVEKLPDDVQSYVKGRVDQAWRGSHMSNPLSTPKLPLGFHARTYDEILSQMLSQIPKQFSKPYED